MTIRVLHIWGPGFKQDFGGQYIFWKYGYENWFEKSVSHHLLDYDDNFIKDASSLVKENAGSHKEYPSRVTRLFWGIKLLWFISNNKKKYDVIHVHTLLWGGLLVAPCAKLLNKVAIYESVLEGSDNPSYIQQRQFGFLMMWCLQKFKRIIAISTSLADDYKKYIPQVDTIPNCVDTTLFTPSKSLPQKKSLRRQNGIPENAKILLFVGSVKHRKGIDILVKLFVRMAEKRPDLFLLVIGPNTLTENKTLNMEYIKDLYSLLQGNHLMDRAKFTGTVKNKSDLANYYQMADIFVFPTRQEGLGNVILEASASQLPIVVTDLPEIKDIITDKINGLFIPKDEIDSFEKAVDLILDDFIVAERIAINARKTAVEKFSFETWQSDLMKCYIDSL